MLPSFSEWTFLRQQVQLFMQDTVSIVTKTVTTNRYGAETWSYTVVSTSIAQLYDASGSEKNIIAALVKEGIDKLQTMKMNLPYSTTLTTDNEILTADGRYWNIATVNDSQTDTAMKQALLYRRLVNGARVE